MKKILFVNDIAYGGGTEKVLQDITANLPGDKFDITVLTFIKDEDFYSHYKKNIRYIYLYEKCMMPQDGQSIITRCINRLEREQRDAYVKRIINNAGYDIVVSIKEGTAMKYAAKLKVPRKIAWIHTDYSVLHWSSGCFASDEEELACMKCFDRVVCVSQNVLQNVKKYVGDSGNMCVLENPIDENTIICKSQEKQNIVAKPQGKVLFVTVGRLCKEKGYDMLIEACERLNSADASLTAYKDAYELWIVGGGELEKELEAQIGRLEVNNVKLLGRQENPYKFLKEADWFISSSRAEGYAIAPQEAAILGVPVIATDCSGVRELLGDSEYGIVIESSTDAIADAMKNVLDNPELRSGYEKAIKERSKQIRLKIRMDKIERCLHG